MMSRSVRDKSLAKGVTLNGNNPNMFEALKQIDNIRLDFSDDNKMLLNITIAIIMFGVALDLKLDDFRKLLSNPKPAFIGILSQFLLMPLLTFLIVLLLRFQITLTVGLGMLLVASCPGGNISNFMSSLARGNVALSVSLTAFTSIGGLILTPLNFSIWGNLYLRYYKSGLTSGGLPPLEVDPLGVFQTIAIILGIPLILGILFKLKFPIITSKLVIHIKRFSILVFTAMIIVIFSYNFDHFINHITYIFFLVLIHNAMALTMGYYVGRKSGLDKRDCKTISIETGIQNSGLALALLFNPTIFPENMMIGGMAFIAAWWGVWHIISGLTIAGIWSGFSVAPKLDME